MRIAVGNARGWRDFSVDKPIHMAHDVELSVHPDGIGVHINPGAEWDVKRACTVTHAWLIDGHNEFSLPLNHPIPVLKGDIFTMTSLDIRSSRDRSFRHSGPNLV